MYTVYNVLPYTSVHLLISILYLTHAYLASGCESGGGGYVLTAADLPPEGNRWCSLDTRLVGNQVQFVSGGENGNRYKKSTRAIEAQTVGPVE